MFDDLTRRFAALVCTAVMSVTCIVAAVGPANAGAARHVAPVVLTA